MGDLIDRQAAIDAVEDTDWYHQNKKGEMVHGANPSDHQAWYKAEDIYNVLESLPSAEPERKKGEWLELTNTNHSYVCSVCGRMLVNITDGKNTVTKNYPFCHCGADMRGDSDE